MWREKIIIFLSSTSVLSMTTSPRCCIDSIIYKSLTSWSLLLTHCLLKNFYWCLRLGYIIWWDHEFPFKTINFEWCTVLNGKSFQICFKHVFVSENQKTVWHESDIPKQNLCEHHFLQRVHAKHVGKYT